MNVITVCVCVCVWHPLFVDTNESCSFLCGRNFEFMSVVLFVYVTYTHRQHVLLGALAMLNLIFDYSQDWRMLLFLLVVSPVLFIKGESLA